MTRTRAVSSRRRPSTEVRAPYQPRLGHVLREVMSIAEPALSDLPEELDGQRLPVTRTQAKRAPSRDLPERDVAEEPLRFHVIRSSSLSLRLLDPREVVAAARRAHDESLVPISAVKGFARQLIGWHELGRGVNWTRGEHDATRDGLGENGELPESWWTASAASRAGCWQVAEGCSTSARARWSPTA